MRLLLCLAILAPIFAQAPKIEYVTNAGYFAGNTLAPGTSVSIYGSRLSESTASAAALPLPRALVGVEVFVCGFDDPISRCTPQQILFASQAQINFLLDYGNRTLSYVAVRRGGVMDQDHAAGNRSYPVRLYINQVTPGVFAAGFDCVAGSADPCGLSAVQQSAGQVMRAMIADANYRPVFSQAPARPGDPLIVWLTGLGFPGVAGDLQARVGIDLSVAIAGTLGQTISRGTVLYAGPTTGFPGLYQLNFTLPAEVVKAASACGRTREVTLRLTSALARLEMPFPVAAEANDPSCR